MTYPLLLQIAGKQTVVVGAGAIATRRVAGLLEAGARVRVIAPQATSEIQQWDREHVIDWVQRPYSGPSDIRDAWLVHTATGIPEVDVAVSTAAEKSRIFCVNAADAEMATAHTPSIHRAEDGVIVAVGGDRDPKRAKAVLNVITQALAEQPLALRRTRRTDRVGQVHLVGAGPGDPDLLTVRARTVLALADTVVVDRLAPHAPLTHLAPGVEVIYVGKEPGAHAATQDGINEIIVAKALEGRRVVRLKGGDPFVLGRGGEEAKACIDAGIPVEVVPGITSAISVPAAAGIPVTHRGITTSFVVVSAHDGLHDAQANIEAAPADATIVLLMGVSHLAELTASLLAAGRPAHTPVAIIESGWTPAQRTTVATLATAPEVALASEVRNPAIIVVGEVVRLRDSLGDLGRISPNAGHVRAGVLQDR
jgi:uroporphyrin-III C-methyltransferase/precorrin-2 dehydrogenase/sirohydrochlorin ferrochelatase